MTTTVNYATTAVTYTCNTCGLTFSSLEYQREHMKTDWHRYNLKRRVADLPPIPAEVFAKKMQQAQLQETATAPSKKQVTKKDLRRQEKEAKRSEQLQNKVGSLNLNRSESQSSLSSVGFSAGEPSRAFISESEGATTTDASDVETDTESNNRASRQSSRSEASGDEDDIDRVLKQKLKSYQEIPPNVCFMDGHVSPTTLDNVKYMNFKYGLVIPDEEHVSDWDGLVRYLNEKVALGNCCLCCSYMGRSLEAVRAHMLSKQHIKIPWDTDEEQAELLEFYEFSDDEYEGEDEGWEDVTADVEDMDETSSEVSSFTDAKVPSYAAYVDGYDLVFGSGKTAGHRSLNRYFKQRAMQPADTAGRRAVKLIDYRSPGVTERAADKMIKSGWAEQKKAQQTFNRGRAMQNFQKHFRDPLLQ